MTKKRSAQPEAAEAVEIITYKGFDQHFRCKDFQFELGKSYEHNGPVKACESGFHGCEHPLNVLAYYHANTSRFARVRQSGEISRHEGDTKIASARITVEAELKLPELIAAAIKYVFDRAKWKDGPVAKGDNEGVINDDRHGAATASGYYGAATASGYCGAATASGDCGAATASGDYGAATASGHCGAATASGVNGRARGANGCALFLVNRDPYTRSIRHAWAGIVGREGIKPDTWYQLNDDGKPVECEP